MKEREETRFFYGWVDVADAAVGVFLGVFPIFVASFTVFFPAFMREFHAQRGESRQFDRARQVSP